MPDNRAHAFAQTPFRTSDSPRQRAYYREQDFPMEEECAMPTLWFVKDGPRPSSRRGAGLSVSLDRVHKAFGEYDALYAGTQAPEFNVNCPSFGPTRVVIEIETGEATDEEFSKAGFYLIDGLSPGAGERLLANHPDT
jgi:hypothetical protein